MNEQVVEVARLSDLARSPWEQILAAVVSQSGVEFRDLCSKNRSSRVTLARHLAMYLGRKLTRLTLEEIGGRLGGRDHTTVLYGVQKIKRQLEHGDQVVAAVVAKIEKAFDPEAALPECSLDVVDPGEGAPTLRVTYRRPDGTRWGVSLPMDLLG